MGRLADLDRELRVREDINIKCDLCSEPGDVYWFRDGSITVCVDCVLEILPRLIADLSLLGYDPDKVIDSTKERYWYGIEKNQAMLVRLLKQEKAEVLIK